jgi:hypothetical protein
MKQAVDRCKWLIHTHLRNLFESQRKVVVTTILQKNMNFQILIPHTFYEKKNQEIHE